MNRNHRDFSTTLSDSIGTSETTLTATETGLTATRPTSSARNHITRHWLARLPTTKVRGQTGDRKHGPARPFHEGTRLFHDWLLSTLSGHSDRSETPRFARLSRRAKWETRSAVHCRRALSTDDRRLVRRNGAAERPRRTSDPRNAALRSSIPLAPPGGHDQRGLRRSRTDYSVADLVNAPLRFISPP